MKKIAVIITIVLLLMGVSPLFAAEPPKLEAGLFRNHWLVMLLINPATGRIVDANKAAVDYYGYTHEQLMQMRIQQINALSRVKVKMEMQRAKRAGNDFFVFRHRLADGSIRAVEVYSSPVRHNGQKLLYSVVIDVSERDALLDTLAENEARHRFAEQVANFGHFILDVNVGEYQLSEGAVTVLGLDQNSYPVEVIRQMTLPQDRQQLDNIIQARMADGESLSGVFRFQRPDGTIIDLDSTGHFDASSQRIFGVIHDISDSQASLRALKSRTATFYLILGAALLVQLGIILLLIWSIRCRRQTEKQLREREEALQQSHKMTSLLLDSTAEGIYGTDKNGHCTFCNAAALQMLGYQEAEQLLGQQMHILIHHHHANGTPFPDTDCPLLQHMEQQQHADDESFWRADGSSFPVEYWSHPVLDENRLVGSVVSFIDISARKAAQRALQQKNKELEQFVYTVSHDLKSPLITINSFLGTLEQDIAVNNSANVKTDMDYIRGATDKMEQLLAALLRLSRVGRMEAAPETVSFRALVDESLSVLAGSIRAHQIEVKVQDADLQLYGDRLQLGQIWQNLIENAIKYRGENASPTLEIGVDHTQKASEFYVRDNGIGIPPEQAERVFGLFAQLNSSSEGCGLGLALVEKIVTHYQGRIRVESDGPGQGSCFKFTLPGAIKRLNTALGAG